MTLLLTIAICILILIVTCLFAGILVDAEGEFGAPEKPEV